MLLVTLASSGRYLATSKAGKETRESPPAVALSDRR